MSTTLARKIRRIGLHRVLTTETVLAKDEQGNEVEIVAQVPVTRRLKLTLEELTERREAIIAEWRARRKRSKSK